MAHKAAYRESHPLVFVITHWINLIAFVCLILSGIYIHSPFVGGYMGIARGMHIFCGFVILINCIVRIILAFVVESSQTEGTRVKVKDYKSWLPQKHNKHQFIPIIKYYLFLKKDHPRSGKFNTLQKLSYWMVPFLIFFMFYTGLCLWAPTQTSGFCQAGISLMGGLPGVRTVHYICMYIFIIFICIHVYLAVAEDPAQLGLMLARKEHEGYVCDPDTGEVIGYDDLSGKVVYADNPVDQSLAQAQEKLSQD